IIRLLRVFVPAGTLALLISEILLVTGAFILASYLILPVDPADYLIYEGGLESIGLVVLSILVGLYLHDLYTEIHLKSSIILLQQLCLVMGIAFLMQGLVSYVDRDLRIPLRVMAVGRDRLLLVGDSPVLVAIAEHIASHPEKGMAVTGYVSDFPDQGANHPGGKVLGPVASLRE